MFTLLDVAIYAAGIVTCWFCKDTVTKWFLGAEGFAVKLEMKLAAVKAKL